MRKSEREARLIPNGGPRWIRVYVTDREVFDPYTVLYVGRKGGWGRTFSEKGDACPCFPFDHSGAPDCVPNRGWAPAIGRKTPIGTRIPFTDLPDRARSWVLKEYREVWSV